MAAKKARKPAIESRVGHSVGSKPKSPVDDFGKWIASKGGKVVQKEIKTIKRYARGIGWSGDFERKGLDSVVEKTTVKGNKKKLADHKRDMYYKKQDKYARTYGDSKGPHERFFKEMNKGSASTKEFNKRANAAWNAEVEIGRKQGSRTSKSTRRYLSGKKKK